MLESLMVWLLAKEVNSLPVTSTKVSCTIKSSVAPIIDQANCRPSSESHCCRKGCRDCSFEKSSFASKEVTQRLIVVLTVKVRQGFTRNSLCAHAPFTFET